MSLVTSCSCAALSQMKPVIPARKTGLERQERKKERKIKKQ